MRSRRATSAPRTKRAPTTLPMEPPMKLNSKALATSGMPLRYPCMTTRASFSPVSFWAAVRRSLYFLVSRNLSLSTGSSSAAISLRPSASRKMSRRRRALVRRGGLHLGQASRFVSSSGRYSAASQGGHLRHSPSGTLLFCASERTMEGISLSTSQLLIANPYLLSGLITLPDRSAIHGCPHIANDRRDTGAGLLRVAQVGGDLTDQHRTHHYPVSHTGDRGGGGAVTNTKTDTDRQIGDGAQLLELFCYL